MAGVPLHGSTDTAILADACRQAQIPAEIMQRHTEAILEAMREVVAEHRNEMDLLLMPGVQQALSHLAAKGALLGVASGNLEAIQRSLCDSLGTDRTGRQKGPGDGRRARVGLRGGRYAA